MTALDLPLPWEYYGTFWLGVALGYLLALLTLAVAWWLGRRLGHIVETTTIPAPTNGEWSQVHDTERTR